MRAEPGQFGSMHHLLLYDYILVELMFRFYLKVKMLFGNHHKLRKLSFVLPFFVLAITAISS